MASVPPNPDLEFSFAIDVTQLAVLGRDYQLAAKESERKKVAVRLGLLDLPKLNAQVHVAPAAGGLVHLNGRVEADVVQECVVTLAPVSATIAENFTMTFLRQAPKMAGKEIDVEPDDDPPEAIQGDVLDLGEVVVEQLALLIDPYPRAPGAVFGARVIGEPEAPKATVSPFAVLAKLKTKS